MRFNIQHTESDEIVAEESRNLRAVQDYGRDHTQSDPYPGSESTGLDQVSGTSQIAVTAKRRGVALVTAHPTP